MTYSPVQIQNVTVYYATDLLQRYAVKNNVSMQPGVPQDFASSAFTSSTLAAQTQPELIKDVFQMANF